MPLNADSWNTAGAQQNIEASTKVIIKPNVYSWRSINVSNAFYTSYNYQRDLESHMMKNMEWGAVAYLTQSKYGRCTEIDGKMTCEEVRINNVGSHITGFSAKNAPTCGYTATNESCNSYEEISKLGIDGKVSYNYYNRESKVASTTGNYSGVYDMAGGATEYVMGVMQTSQNDATPASGRRQSDNSGFNGLCLTDNYKKEDGKPWPSSKYYDLYDYAQTSQNYNQGKLGDGTKEFGPFYNVVYQSSAGIGPARFAGSYNANTALFVDSGHPWFLRGGDYLPGTDAGPALFSNSGGDANKDQSFRIILAS